MTVDLYTHYTLVLVVRVTADIRLQQHIIIIIYIYARQ